MAVWLHGWGVSGVRVGRPALALSENIVRIDGHVWRGRPCRKARLDAYQRSKVSPFDDLPQIRDVVGQVDRPAPDRQPLEVGLDCRRLALCPPAVRRRVRVRARGKGI